MVSTEISVDLGKDKVCDQEAAALRVGLSKVLDGRLVIGVSGIPGGDDSAGIDEDQFSRQSQGLPR